MGAGLDGWWSDSSCDLLVDVFYTRGKEWDELWTGTSRAQYVNTHLCVSGAAN